VVKFERVLQKPHFWHCQRGQQPPNPTSATGGYDAVGNRTFTRNLLADQDNLYRSERYGYDNLNRLTVMDRGILNEDGTAVPPAAKQERSPAVSVVVLWEPS
jgi:hypothetical protein